MISPRARWTYDTHHIRGAFYIRRWSRRPRAAARVPHGPGALSAQPSTPTPNNKLTKTVSTIPAAINKKNSRTSAPRRDSA